MKALVIMHCESEGPGTLGEFFHEQGVEVLYARLYNGDRLRETRGLDCVVSMGGPMNVYEEDRYPFLREETAFLRQVVEEGMPVIGICLGAQMIAKAMGGRVGRSPAPEVGWGRVELTGAGRKEPLLAGMDPAQDVLQWHGDMFEVPPGGALLARSAACPNQAFRVRNALGLQFHLEVDEPIIRRWFGDREDCAAMVEQYRGLEPGLRREAGKLYRNFLKSTVAK